MTLSPLTAVTPVDGRYRRATAALSDYFSEGALIRYRVRVEIEYFIALCRLPLPQLAGVDPAIFDRLHETCRTFTMADAAGSRRSKKPPTTMSRRWSITSRRSSIDWAWLNTRSSSTSA
jgi:adenylosuccinate lyase